MSLEINDSFLQLTIKEIETDDPFYDTLQKIRDHLQISFTNPGAGGLVITREGFNDAFVGTYTIRETGSGALIGAFKAVGDSLVPITFSLPNEIRIVEGSGTGEFQPPAGWEIHPDEQVQNKYNIGTSPNWLFAAVRYIGI